MNRTIYIAGVYEDRLALQFWKQEFERVGHTVVASWLYETAPRGSLNDEQNMESCLRDLHDIDACDVVVLFGDSERRGEGGRNVELGYAIGTGKLIIAVEFRENPFWFHPSVKFVEYPDGVLLLL